MLLTNVAIVSGDVAWGQQQPVSAISTITFLPGGREAIKALMSDRVRAYMLTVPLLFGAAAKCMMWV
jgi:hypothetical protein